MFAAVLFAIKKKTPKTKKQKHPDSSWGGEQHIHTVEYYTAMKKPELDLNIGLCSMSEGEGQVADPSCVGKAPYLYNS